MRRIHATGAALTDDPGKPIGRFLDAQAAVNQAAIGAVGRMEVFAPRLGQGLVAPVQTAPNNGWSGWNSLGGWIDPATVGRNADGGLRSSPADRTAAGTRRQMAPNNGWSGWASLGGWIDL